MTIPYRISLSVPSRSTPSSGEGLARRSETRIVQETAIELRDEEVVEVGIRCSAADQDMDEVAAVTGVAVGDGCW